MSHLTVFAGPRAFRHVRRHGLRADDISAVFGASGAAKWLTIHGLDVAVFTRFLQAGTREVQLFGTSIGAFKLAAAAQETPADALNRLAEAYVEQSYGERVTPAQIATESARITGHMLGDAGVDQVLAHPRYRFHCGTVRCRGSLASDHPLAQRAGMLAALLRSRLGRRRMSGSIARAVFSDPRAPTAFPGADGFPTEVHALTRENFPDALLASGSIPVVMAGVRGLPDGATYRDGGLFDYHPVPSNLATPGDGLVLYPHFYRHLVEGWFDKFFGAPKVSGERLQDVILLAPSDDYVAALPGGQIPDRKDFHTFAGRDDVRQQRWNEAIERSRLLGEQFVELVESGAIADVMVPFEVG